MGAGKATTRRVLMEKRGVGVMEGAVQRYTGWDRTETHFSCMNTMTDVGSFISGSEQHVMGTVTMGWSRF